MPVLVTGAGGFIGSHVVREIVAEGRPVRAMLAPGESRRNLDGLGVEVFVADVVDRDAVARAVSGCDVVYHLAAIYALFNPEPRRIFRVNVDGTRTVLWACLKAGVERVVYTSSIAALGVAPSEIPSDERTEFDCFDVADEYVMTKYLAEQEALAFAREGLPVVIVNPAFPFGARDARPTPTGQIVLNVLRGAQPGYIPGGFNCIDVEDVAKGHLLAERKGVAGERYILGHRNVTHRDFARLCCEIAGAPFRDRRLPAWLLGPMVLYENHVAWPLLGRRPYGTWRTFRYGYGTHLYYDCSKAVRDLGLPQTPIEDAIRKAIAWFRDNGYVG